MLGSFKAAPSIALSLAGETYDYVVNGKSAIEWIMERYQVKTDKKSGITNDPNDWAEEVGQPRYILDLLLSIVNRLDRRVIKRLQAANFALHFVNKPR